MFESQIAEKQSARGKVRESNGESQMWRNPFSGHKCTLFTFLPMAGWPADVSFSKLRKAYAQNWDTEALSTTEFCLAKPLVAVRSAVRSSLLSVRKVLTQFFVFRCRWVLLSFRRELSWATVVFLKFWNKFKQDFNDVVQWQWLLHQVLLREQSHLNSKWGGKPVWFWRVSACSWFSTVSPHTPIQHHFLKVSTVLLFTNFQRINQASFSISFKVSFCEENLAQFPVQNVNKQACLVHPL